MAAARTADLLEEEMVYDDGDVAGPPGAAPGRPGVPLVPLVLGLDEGALVLGHEGVERRLEEAAHLVLDLLVVLGCHAGLGGVVEHGEGRAVDLAAHRVHVVDAVVDVNAAVKPAGKKRYFSCLLSCLHKRDACTPRAKSNYESEGKVAEGRKKRPV